MIKAWLLPALRWLRMTHSGRVKCIYIDPPYNTGNKDWVYNDHYMNSEDRFRQSTWLEFLHRRLTLAHPLNATVGKGTLTAHAPSVACKRFEAPATSRDLRR